MTGFRFAANKPEGQYTMTHHKTRSLRRFVGTVLRTIPLFAAIAAGVISACLVGPGTAGELPPLARCSGLPGGGKLSQCLVDNASAAWALFVADFGRNRGDRDGAGKAHTQSPAITWRQISGIYPHLAATSQSYTECGIGAVVPWAGKLWYVSYVAHIVGEGVGLYEIDPDLSIRKRPESIVGTHAGRMVHRESNQLFLGPYVIDEAGQVRVIDGLKNERITAFARHLFTPAEKVYAQAMEGKLYEVDVHTLAVNPIVDLSREELAIEGRAHFKGAYTSQGRLVIANNTYDASDALRGFGGGRLAEWDGTRWRVIQKTAYCDVTTPAGVWAIPDDPGPLWATGWDRSSLLLSVLVDGKWSHFRLPKASQSHDHAWCTEWPRINRLWPDISLMDMHGMFFRMRADFAPGRAWMEPWAAHLRIVPDFCLWNGTLVLAGNQNSAMLFGPVDQGQPRHRTGGQPQSNLWFGKPEELATWGEPHGWGSTPLSQPAKVEPLDQPSAWSEPLLVAGYRNRSLFVLWDLPPRFHRCTGAFLVEECPSQLLGLARVTVRRGDMTQPGVGYSFSVNQPVIVYLAVHDRGKPQVPPPWKPTGWQIRWRHDDVYTDTVYVAEFPPGTVVIPEHRGQNERGHFGVPHLCFVAPVSKDGPSLEIGDLPAEKGAVVERGLEGLWPAEKLRVVVEADRDGSGRYEPLFERELGGGEPAWWLLPDDESVRWLRLASSAPAPIALHLCAAPGYESGRRKAERFGGLADAGEARERLGAVGVPLAECLWLHVFTEGPGGRQPLGLFPLTPEFHAGQVTQIVTGSGVAADDRPILAWNRKMIGRILSIGPYLVNDRGEVRRIKGLPPTVLVATLRHPAGPQRCYLLDEQGTLFEVDVAAAEVIDQVEISQLLGFEPGQVLFRAGHQTGPRLIVAGISSDGKSGVLAEGEGTTWRLVDNRPYVELCNLGSMSEEVVAIGWDQASALWMVRGLDGRWELLRFPMASDAYQRQFATYRPRIREVETERVLVDCHGFFYEVSGLPYARSIVPVCAHNLLLSDFASFRGLFVLCGVRTDAPESENLWVQEPLRAWFGKTDDLWQLREPQGFGGPWLRSAVRAGEPSAPFLIYGFRRKSLRLGHNLGESVTFNVEVDPTVSRRHWVKVASVVVPPGQGLVYELPVGLSAHWMRVAVDRTCLATAYLELGP